jgi:hypothetical protein
MRRILTVAFAATTMLLTSCSNPEIEEMVAIIDSSYSAVQKSEAELMSIDTAVIGKMVRYNTTALSAIQNNFKDTATKEQSIFISDINAVRRSFSKLNVRRESLIKDMIYAKSQLNDIKKDVKNGLMTPQDFDDHFPIEQQAVELFITTVQGSIIWNESNTKRFETMKPQIEKFLEEINKTEQ